MPTPYTHKKLTDVTDSAPEFGLGDSGEVRFAGQDFDAADTGFTHHRMLPNAHPGFGHRHQEAEEVYVILSGSGRMKIEDEIIEVEPLDAVRVQPTAWRSFAAGPDGLEVIAFGRRHEGDGEVDPQWWTE